VYPEGGLGPDGGIGEFKKGAFVLAYRTGVPIVPILMRGTRRVLNIRERTNRPGPVRVDILDPIPAADWPKGKDAEGLARLVRERMVEAGAWLDTV
jgi:1-acyl-sn-glycerol-3-phosphate acyltransferase